MANIPIIGKVTVGGTTKELSDGYVNIGGVWKPIVKTYVNVNGVWMSAWKNLTTWKKYTTKSVTEYAASTGSRHAWYNDSGSTSVYTSSSYSLDSATGKFTLPNYTKKTISQLVDLGILYFSEDSSRNLSYIHRHSSSEYIDAEWGYRTYRWTLKATQTTKQVADTYVSDVISENESEYPSNGVHTDGYWYVKQ